MNEHNPSQAYIPAFELVFFRLRVPVKLYDKWTEMKWI